MSASMPVNFNVGVLGHVDSGKTALVKALSTTASTAAFDKNPQSRERGITLDLGFSSFNIKIPDHLRDGANVAKEQMQITLVDCPGHASLIRTIIGGAQIIDLMMLVIDITKGIQTQTAECLVIGEISCEHMIVVLNKIDVLTPEKQKQTIEKVTKRIQKTLMNTKFASSPVVPVSAKPGGPEGSNVDAVGMPDLVEVLRKTVYLPKRDATGDFVFAVDHCFIVRGQGTVMTGTVLHGSIAINDTVEISAVKEKRKVKSIQMFKKPVEKAVQGDRVGICVTQFDAKLLERGLVFTPGCLPTLFAAVVSVNKIPYFKGKCSSKAKFHISIGHETVMGKVTYFALLSKDVSDDKEYTFDFNKEYFYQDELFDKGTTGGSAEATTGSPEFTTHYALIEFEHPVTCIKNSLVIGSKLDSDIHLNMCRIAFHGKVLEPICVKNYEETVLPQLRVYKSKSREGFVDRMVDEYTVIGRSLFKKESSIQNFIGLRVELSTGEMGVIESGFGQSGKFKVRILKGLQPSTVASLSATRKNREKSSAATPSSHNVKATVEKVPIKITVAFKRYVYDLQKKMVQS